MSDIDPELWMLVHGGYPGCLEAIPAIPDNVWSYLQETYQVLTVPDVEATLAMLRGSVSLKGVPQALRDELLSSPLTDPDTGLLRVVDEGVDAVQWGLTDFVPAAVVALVNGIARSLEGAEWATEYRSEGGEGLYIVEVAATTSGRVEYRVDVELLRTVYWGSESEDEQGYAGRSATIFAPEDERLGDDPVAIFEALVQVIERRGDDALVSVERQIEADEAEGR